MRRTLGTGPVSCKSGSPSASGNTSRAPPRAPGRSAGNTEDSTMMLLDWVTPDPPDAYVAALTSKTKPDSTYSHQVMQPTSPGARCRAPYNLSCRPEGSTYDFHRDIHPRSTFWARQRERGVGATNEYYLYRQKKISPREIRIALLRTAAVGNRTIYEIKTHRWETGKLVRADNRTYLPGTRTYPCGTSLGLGSRTHLHIPFDTDSYGTDSPRSKGSEADSPFSSYT